MRVRACVCEREKERHQSSLFFIACFNDLPHLVTSSIGQLWNGCFFVCVFFFPSPTAVKKEHRLHICWPTTALWETTTPYSLLGITHEPQSISCWGNRWLSQHKGSSFVINPDELEKQKYLYLQSPKKVNDKGNVTLHVRQRSDHAVCACCVVVCV